METPPARTRPLPDLRFRVLVAGRANAGKTSILQRVCETTESPEIRRVGVVDYQEVWEKIDNLDPTPERGKHDISDELTFTNHTGYVFHDSGGFECGGKKELEVVQDFIRERSRRRNLRDRVHAIWYCIPMDSERPMFDIDPLHEICPDKNVPVIPVFTKYDAFKLEVRWRLEDDGNLRGDEETQCEAVFKEQYLNRLRGVSKFVRLEGMDEHGACCNELIMTTMDALNNGTVTMMLLAAQRGNLELNVGRAVRRCMAKANEPHQDGRSSSDTRFLRMICWGRERITQLLQRRKSRGNRVDIWSGIDKTEAVLMKECLQSFPLIFFAHDDDAADAAYADHHADPKIKPLVSPLTRLINELHSSTYIAALIITIRHATLTAINHDVAPKTALKQACRDFLASDMADNIQQWLTAHPNWSEEEIVQFINANFLTTGPPPSTPFRTLQKALRKLSYK